MSIHGLPTSAMMRADVLTVVHHDDTVSTFTDVTYTLSRAGLRVLTANRRREGAAELRHPDDARPPSPPPPRRLSRRNRIVEMLNLMAHTGALGEGGAIISPGIIGQAAGLFAVTNIDDILILALFFAQGAGHRHTTRNIAAGQYLGFAGILAVAVAAAFGATFLPDERRSLPRPAAARAGRQGRRPGVAAPQRRRRGRTATRTAGPASLAVAAVTFANGGDNIGVYVPVFATAGAGGMAVYVIVFLVLVAVWVAAGRYFATRPIIAKALSRWGHLLLPVVLIGIGLLILVEGGAFGR